MMDIPINLAVEDDLSEAILKEMLKQSQRPFAVGMCLKRLVRPLADIIARWIIVTNPNFLITRSPYCAAHFSRS